MVENKNILRGLIIVILIMIILEIVVGFLNINNNLKQHVFNIVLGVLTSSIVSAIMVYLTYKYKCEETKEKLIKNLIEIYSKLVLLKCIYKNSKNKNDLIVKCQTEIDDYLGIIHDIEYDLVHKLKLLKLEDTLVLINYNNKTIRELVNGTKFENGKFINKAKGLNNQKEFINSFNNRLNKVRDYLDRFCVEKYIMKYRLIKAIDIKFEDIESNSNTKIKYNNCN